MSPLPSRRALALPLAVAALSLAACKTEAPTTDDVPDAGPFVPNKETWGRNKVRKDEDKAAAKGALQAGVAVRLLDGPVGTSMAGYGGRGRGRQTHWNDLLKGSTGFYGMQSVKAVVVSVGDERLALVKSPLMSSESYMTDAIARHLKDEHNLDFRGRVITMAGHSHHATARYWPLPELLGAVGADSFDPEVAETNAGIFAAAIAEAWANRAPAEWAHGTRENWDPDDEVYRDRRENNDPTYGKDPRLSLVAFRRKADAVPLAVVINFPIHGTAFGGENDMFTEDAPGYVEHKFEELFFATKGKPVFGMFSQAAGGDASPAGDALGHPTLARLERMGEAAAPKLLALYDSLSWSSDTELAVRSQRIELVHSRIYDGRPWAQEFADDKGQGFTWGAWQCFGEKDAKSMEGKPKSCVDMEKFLSLLQTDVPHDAAHQAYLTAARLGDLWLMTIPGEPTWSLVKYAREQAAQRRWGDKPMSLMVVGYSQDHLLYFSAPDDWYLGGYESEMSLWGPGGGVFLVDEQLKMIDAMIAGKNGPLLFEESPALSPVREWQPRPRERSVAAGEVVEQPAASLARTQTARFAANCGDPALSSPLVKLQRKQGGAFADVPALHGWPGKAYDNTRYEMVSAYDPVPPQANHAAREERTHTWRFYWQVPADWAAGTYRFQLACNAVRAGAESTTPEALSVASTPFDVTGAPEGSTLGVQLEGRKLSLTLRVPGVEEETSRAAPSGDGVWSSAGYRLLDGRVHHTDPALVRAALKAELLDAQGAVLSTVDVPYSAAAHANVATLTADPPASAVSVRAWLAADTVPAKLTTPLAR